MNLNAEILIVEDSPTQAERLRLLLESSGYRVRAATNAEEALALLREHPPELVITDIVMPGMNGYELCSRIKSDRQHYELPVILLTTLSEPGDIIKSLQCGADNYIRKPYDDRYLLTRVGNILTGRELRDGGRMGVEVFLGGERHFISSERQQILDFLLSTYEETMQLNEELEQRAAEVQAKNAELEARQVQLEQALSDLDAEKRHVEELANVNRAVLDATTDGIALIDNEGRTLLWNAALARMSATIPGANLEAPLDENLRAVTAICGQPDEYRSFIESLLSGSEREGSFDLELPGAKQWLRVFGAPVQDASGESLGHIFVARDVTRDREVDLLKSELVSTVSHELRTPLTGILGYAELLRAPDLDESNRQEYLEIIVGEAQRLARLLNDFLDLQRIEAGLFDVQLDPVDLAQIVSRQVQLFAGYSKAHELRADLPDEPLVASGEQGRLSQTVANLLSNAIKYSPKGGVVEVSVGERGGFAEVSVRDHGIGIPAEFHGRLFTKFFRVDSSDTRSIGGTGLGLSLCREIVLAHGGEMGFESEAGAGSTFWFRIPLAESSRSADTDVGTEAA